MCVGYPDLGCEGTKGVFKMKFGKTKFGKTKLDGVN